MAYLEVNTNGDRLEITCGYQLKPGRPKNQVFGKNLVFSLIVSHVKLVASPVKSFRATFMIPGKIEKRGL